MFTTADCNCNTTTGIATRNRKRSSLRNEFQAFVAATRNARSPIVEWRVDGMSSLHLNQLLALQQEC